MTQYSQEPGYVQNQAITGSAWSSKPIWIATLNQINLQMQLTSALSTGTLSLYGSNQDLPGMGSISYVLPIPLPSGFTPPAPVSVPQQPVPLAPMLLANAISTSTGTSAFFDVVTAAAWVWVTYSGSASGSLSIAFTGKAYS